MERTDTYLTSIGGPWFKFDLTLNIAPNKLFCLILTTLLANTAGLTFA